MADVAKAKAEVKKNAVAKAQANAEDMAAMAEAEKKATEKARAKTQAERKEAASPLLWSQRPPRR